jgi:MFS family permease
MVWLDEIVFATLTPFWSEAFNLSSVEIATIASAYLLGYFPLLLVSGILSDILGPRKMLLIAVAGCGVLSAAILLCKDADSMYWRNFFFGIFFGFNWAPCQKLISNWFPQKDISTAAGYWNTVSTITGIGGAPAALAIAVTLGWQQAFLIITAISIPIFILILIVRDFPTQTKGISPEEIDYINKEKLNTTGEKVKTRAGDIFVVFKDWRVWMALLVSMIATGPTWLPSTWGSMLLMNGLNYSATETATIMPFMSLFGVAAGLAAPFLFRACKGNMRIYLSFGTLVGGTGFVLVGLLDLPPLLAAIFAMGICYCGNPWSWGGLTSYWAGLFKDKPEVLGTMNGAGAAIQVAFGYGLVQMSGSWVGTTDHVGGYGNVFLYGGIIWFSCLIFIMLIRNVKVKL